MSYGLATFNNSGKKTLWLDNFTWRKHAEIIWRPSDLIPVFPAADLEACFFFPVAGINKQAKYYSVTLASRLLGDFVAENNSWLYKPMIQTFNISAGDKYDRLGKNGQLISPNPTGAYTWGTTGVIVMYAAGSGSTSRYNAWSFRWSKTIVFKSGN
jgi:hypothetical protein